MLFTYDSGLSSLDIPIANFSQSPEVKTETVTTLDGSDYEVESYRKWLYKFSTPPIELAEQAAIESVLDSLRDREAFSFVHPSTGEVIYVHMKGEWRPTRAPLSHNVSYSFKAKQA